MIRQTVPSEPHWIFRASLRGLRGANLVNVKYLAFLLAVGLASAATLDMAGKPRDPSLSRYRLACSSSVRTDCPITNRYAPELQRLSHAYAPRQQSSSGWSIPDPSESTGKNPEAAGWTLVSGLPGSARSEP